MDKNGILQNSWSFNDYVKRDGIIKHSKDIIDLLEYGDFITLGKDCYPLQIRNIYEHGGEINIVLSNGTTFEDVKNDTDFKVHSVLTKEQYKSVKYVF